MILQACGATVEPLMIQVGGATTEPLWIGLIGIVIVLILIAIGVHIALAFAVLGFVGISLIVGLDAAILFLTTTAFYKVTHVAFAVVPLFILVGLIAATGGISRDTYEALSLWLNKVRGGLGIATVAGCTAFGTVCGSSLVTASVFARASCPDMRRMGYDKRLAYGLVSAAGNIGMLIPPSIVIVVYGILTEESIGKLLIAGLTPGLLLFFTFSLGLLIFGYWKPSMVGYPMKREVTWRQRLVGLKLLWPIATCAAIIIGGVFGGVLSPTEAGAAAVAVLFFFVLISQRSLKALAPGFAEAAAITAMIFFIFIGAGMFARFLMLTGIAPLLLNVVVDMNLSHLGMVIVMCVVYIIMGCLLDAISMIGVTVPIIYPIIRAMGIDPIWYGICVILAIHIGTITPPVGLNVYAVKGVAEADVSLEDIFFGVWPWFLWMLVSLAFVIAFPALSTTLPNIMLN